MTLPWKHAETLPPKKYVCGCCGAHTGPNMGYYPEGYRSDQKSNLQSRMLYICTNCGSPTFFLGEKQTPGTTFGKQLQHHPPTVAEAYEEARLCMSVSAYTAVTLLCRKLLMNVAVAEGADPGKHFVVYVDYLEANSYVPPKGKPWVDRIRDLGNTATHEIRLPSQHDAEQALTFVEMLLSFVYEMPGRLASPPPTP